MLDVGWWEWLEIETGKNMLARIGTISRFPTTFFTKAEPLKCDAAVQFVHLPITKYEEHSYVITIIHLLCTTYHQCMGHFWRLQKVDADYKIYQ